MLAAAAYVLASPGWLREALFLAGVCGPVAATAAGARRYRPAQARVWWLLAAGQGAAAAGYLLSLVYRHLLDRDPVPGPANHFYGTSFLLLVAALIVLDQAGRRGRDLLGAVDTGIIFTGLSLVMWAVVVAFANGSSIGLPVSGRVLGAGYSVGAALVLALLLRLLTAGGRRGRAYWLLLAAAGGCLVSTLTYQALTVRHGMLLAPANPGVTGPDAGLLLSYGLFAGAALHPSMRQLAGTARDDGPAALTVGRLAVLGAATLVAPGAVAVALLRGERLDGWVIAAGSAVMSLLVLARMALLLRAVHAQARQLAALADSDPLTGGLNRRAWERALVAELARAQRAVVPLALAVLDVDHFKAYNDVHGHPGGDRLLRQAAGRWRARLRSGDVLARLGGDEFAVLLPACSLPAALTVIDGLREATPAGCSVSVGVASWDRREDAAALTARADAALYEAKRRGRGQTAIAADEPPTAEGRGVAPPAERLNGPY